MDDISDVEILVESSGAEGSYSATDNDYAPCVGCGNLFHAEELDENELCTGCGAEVCDGIY